MVKQWSLGCYTVPDIFPDSLLVSCGTLAPFSLCSCSQLQSSPMGLTSKAWASAPAPTHPHRWADKPLRLVSAGQHWSSVQEFLCFALCTPVAVLSSVVPKPPPPLPATPCHCQWRGFLVCGNFSSFTVPSQRGKFFPHSFVSVLHFFFCLTQVHGEFLAFWEVWGLLPAFSRCSVGVVPHVDVVLMYLWGGRWSPCLTPLPSLGSPLAAEFSTEILHASLRLVQRHTELCRCRLTWNSVTHPPLQPKWARDP